MKIGILGLGSIASCVAEDLARQGHNLLVTERSRERSATLTKAFATVHIAAAQEIIDQSDLVVLGMTGAAATAALPELSFAPDQKVVSLMADIDQASLNKLLAPAALDAALIPFPWIAQTRSPAMAMPKTPLLEELFGERHDLLEVENEDAMRAFLTAQAVLSPGLKLAETAKDWLAAKTGDTDTAEAFLRSLLGTALMAPRETDAFSLANLLEALNTPGGYNQILRLHMEQAGTFKALEDGLDKLYGDA